MSATGQSAQLSPILPPSPEVLCPRRSEELKNNLFATIRGHLVWGGAPLQSDLKMQCDSNPELEEDVETDQSIKEVFLEEMWRQTNHGGPPGGDAHSLWPWAS